MLDEQKLIWIGPKDAGNAVNVDIRMGKTIMGMWRMLEHYNIDRSRFYVTGNSGGARTAQVLSWLHPRSITGAFPLCGASYFRETTQEFETHEPDSHYEYWGDYFYPNIGGTPFSEWILDYPRPVALLTSTDDFRRGDMLNVFHHGLQADDIQRYLQWVETTVPPTQSKPMLINWTIPCLMCCTMISQVETSAVNHRDWMD